MSPLTKISIFIYLMVFTVRANCHIMLNDSLRQDSINVISVSVVEDRFIEVRWVWPTNLEAFSIATLERDDGDGFRPVSRFRAERSNTLFIDSNVDPSVRPYAYRIVAEDSCRNSTVPGRGGTTIFLQAEGGATQVRLNWNAYEGWENGVASYEIQIFNGVLGFFRTIGNVQGDITEFIYDDSNLIPGTNCYRIIANEAQGNGTISFSNEACVTLESLVFIPSAFSPNEDGINDTFSLRTQYVSGFLFRVYSRWGEIIFESNDPNFEWNGTTPDGNPVKEGAYAFIMLSRGFDNLIKRETGTITIIR